MKEKSGDNVSDGKIGLWAIVALVTKGNLGAEEIVAAKDYALAEAVRPFLGQAGFTLIAIAAMLSAASALIIEGGYRLAKRELRLHE